jgi:hypothetical protein
MVDIHMTFQEETTMTRLQGILAAGGLTGIVAATVVAIGVKGFAQASTPTSAPMAAPIVEPQVTPAVDPAVDPAVLAQYQAQIEQANQTIQQLQAERDKLAQQAAGATQAPRGGEHEYEAGSDD